MLLNALDVVLNDVGSDAPVKDVAIGAYGCMVVSRHAGLSSSFRGSCSPAEGGTGHGHGVSLAGGLIGMSAIKLAEYARSDNLLDASVGVAALNSLIAPDPASLSEINAAELIAKRGKGKTVAVVGHFPFVERLRHIADVRLIQKNPWDREEALREAEEKIPGCEVVALTASSIINHTFDRLLQLSRGAFVIALGPSTPMSVNLFQLGIGTLCGTVVDDVDVAKSCITQGATYREIKGIRRVAMSAPGI
jgi:uncharacterized protein (DUF4213/DUF364 family)